jgi:hypothetical protein
MVRHSTFAAKLGVSSTVRSHTFPYVTPRGQGIHSYIRGKIRIPPRNLVSIIYLVINLFTNFKSHRVQIKITRQEIRFQRALTMVHNNRDYWGPSPGILKPTTFRKLDGGQSPKIE